MTRMIAAPINTENLTCSKVAERRLKIKNAQNAMHTFSCAESRRVRFLKLSKLATSRR